MKAAVFYEPGPPDVLRYEDVPAPEPADDQLLVRVEAISVEGGDTLHRARMTSGGLAHIVGYQCAGTVIATGKGVTGYREGDRVVTVAADGSHAELRAVSARTCWRVPDGLTVEEAVCVPIAFGTAHDALFEFGRLEAGETVLVHAGASGVGIAAIQLAKRAGARVLATASSAEKLQRLGEFGLDHGINYREADLGQEIDRLTGGAGVDVVLDTVGGDTAQRSLDCLAYRGRLVSIGDAGRQPGAVVEVARLRPQNHSVIGYFLGGELARGDRAHALIARLLSDVAAGRLHVVIDRSFSLAEAAAAHAYSESRQAFGRVLLIP